MIVTDKKYLSAKTAEQIFELLKAIHIACDESGLNAEDFKSQIGQLTRHAMNRIYCEIYDHEEILNESN